MNKHRLHTVLRLLLLILIGTFPSCTSKRKVDDEKGNVSELIVRQDSVGMLSNISKYSFSQRNKQRVDTLRNRTETIHKVIDNFKNDLVGAQSPEIFLFKDSNAAKLKFELIAYKRFIKDSFSEELRGRETRINTDDQIEEGKTISWEKAYFADLPIAAIIMILKQKKIEIK